MNRKDRRTLKSIERRARRAVDTLLSLNTPSGRSDTRPGPRALALMRHAAHLIAQVSDKGLTSVSN